MRGGGKEGVRAGRAGVKGGGVIYTRLGSPSVSPTPARRGRNKQPWKRIVKIDDAAISSSSIQPRHKRSAMLRPALFSSFCRPQSVFFLSLSRSLSFSLAGPELNLDFYFIEIYCCRGSRALRRLLDAAEEEALPLGMPRAAQSGPMRCRVYFLPDRQTPGL